MIFKYDSWLLGISLLILSDVLIRWVTLLNGIFTLNWFIQMKYLLV